MGISARQGLQYLAEEEEEAREEEDSSGKFIT